MYPSLFVFSLARRPQNHSGASLDTKHVGGPKIFSKIGFYFIPLKRLLFLFSGSKRCSPGAGI